jgi:hypothetical protein
MSFMLFMVQLKYYDIMTLCEFINWFMVLVSGFWFMVFLGGVWTIR